MSQLQTPTGTLIISGPHPTCMDISYDLLQQRDVWLHYERPVKLSDKLPHSAAVAKEFNALNAVSMTNYHQANMRTDIPSRLNRYSDIIPCNIKLDTHSLVTLNSPPGYINANWISVRFIKGIEFPLQRNQFIATQGPLDNTIPDFWEMVNEQNVNTIVMLCNTVEANAPKCAGYWPAAMAQMNLRQGNIINTQEEQRNGYVVRQLDFQPAMGDRKQVTQIHYTQWPDRGLPADLTALDQIIDIIRQRQSPIVVHCSAGVGRTGSFIAMFYIKHAILAGATELSVFSIVRRLREQRILMVQTAEQYNMLYDYIRMLIRKQQLLFLNSQQNTFKMSAVCKYCSITVANTILEAHQTLCNRDAGVYYCPHCNESVRKSERDIHLKLCAELAPAQSEPEGFITCEQCNYQVASSEIADHMFLHEFEEAGPELIRQNTANLVQGQEGDVDEDLMQLLAEENGMTLEQLQEFLRDQAQVDFSYQSMNEDGRLDDTSFRRLPSISYNQNMREQSCMICIYDFDPDERVTVLPCFHAFHKECVQEWLSRKAECPVCKTNI